MRVLVDTSVWVDFFNAHPSPQAAALERCLREDIEIVTCGVVAAEVLQGLRRGRSRETIERHFLEMDWLTPTEPATWFGAAELYRALRARGITVRSLADCVVARLAHEHAALLLFKDRDLELIARSGLLEIGSFPLPACS